jgi:hypothetical protein
VRETFNLNNACFDEGPRSDPPGPVHIIHHPSIQQRVTTAYWVQVGADGSQRNWRSTARQRTPFDVRAVRWIQQSLTFSPAQKDGRAVAGWVLVTIQGRTQQ